MTGRDLRPDRRDELLDALIEECVEFDHEVIALDHHTWAIHGRIAYDGEVIAVTYPSEAAARAGLTRVAELERRSRRGDAGRH